MTECEHEWEARPEEDTADGRRFQCGRCGAWGWRSRASLRPVRAYADQTKFLRRLGEERARAGRFVSPRGVRIGGPGVSTDSLPARHDGNWVPRAPMLDEEPDE